LTARQNTGHTYQLGELRGIRDLPSPRRLVGSLHSNPDALWRAQPDNVFLVKMSDWFSS